MEFRDKFAEGWKNLFLLAVAIVLAVLIIYPVGNKGEDISEGELYRFESDAELLSSIENLSDSGYDSYLGGDRLMALSESVDSSKALGSVQSNEYSETNVQVKGVDEADIIKTDGEYIYMINSGKFVVLKGYPVGEAEVLSEVEFFDEQFSPYEIFVEGDRVLVFGSTYIYDPRVYDSNEMDSRIYPYYGSLTSVRIYDVSDKEDVELVRNVEFEGDYATSRKIDEYVYFVINSYPVLYDSNPEVYTDVVPLYKDSELENLSEVEPTALVTSNEIGYVRPIQSRNFVSVVSISMIDEDEEIEKEVIVGSGQNVYASLDNLYIVEGSWMSGDSVVLKYSLDKGDIDFKGTGKVSGHILNQFSMDEYEGNFRIATTKRPNFNWGVRPIEDTRNENEKVVNNMYVLDEDLEVIGSVEDIAPGESIYSVRFMGERAYMVTFLQVDPLFVIDLSNPTNPKILGKLKIPGYSNYLHPYDEDHVIGIGNEVDAKIDADKIHDENAVYYTAVQGVKLSIFDVSDVENPIEKHKVVIGDRGTTSTAQYDHKSFLFDKNKGLLVIPIIVYEQKDYEEEGNVEELLPEQVITRSYPEAVFDGAYVYDVDLNEGFDLRGKVSHYEDTEEFEKQGYYFYGSHSILRSLYIEDVLYTMSEGKLQLNDLDSLEKLKSFEFEREDFYEGVVPLMREMRVSITD